MLDRRLLGGAVGKDIFVDEALAREVAGEVEHRRGDLRGPGGRRREQRAAHRGQEMFEIRVADARRDHQGAQQAVVRDGREGAEPGRLLCPRPAHDRRDGRIAADQPRADPLELARRRPALAQRAPDRVAVALGHVAILQGARIEGEQMLRVRGLLEAERPRGDLDGALDLAGGMELAREIEIGVGIGRIERNGALDMGDRLAGLAGAKQREAEIIVGGGKVGPCPQCRTAVR